MKKNKLKKTIMEAISEALDQFDLVDLDNNWEKADEEKELRTPDGVMFWCADIIDRRGIISGGKALVWEEDNNWAVISTTNDGFHHTGFPLMITTFDKLDIGDVFFSWPQEYLDDMGDDVRNYSIKISDTEEIAFNSPKYPLEKSLRTDSVTEEVLKVIFD